MAELDHTGELYKRYVQMLGDQETRIADLRSKIDDLQQKETSLQDALNQYLTNFNLP